MIGIFGIVVALALLIYLAFRGLSVLILGPAMALVAVLIAGGLPILGAYTQKFMQSTGNFIVLFFPLFLLGAIFGKLPRFRPSVSFARQCWGLAGTIRSSPWPWPSMFWPE